MARVCGWTFARLLAWSGGAVVFIGLGAAAPVAAQGLPFTGQPAAVFSPPPPPPPAQTVPRPMPQGPVAEPHRVLPSMPQGRFALALSARYAADGPIIPRSLRWRVYSTKPGAGGNPTLMAEASDPYPVFALLPGEYVVHVAYGLAGTVKRVSLTGDRRETVIVPAGGLRLQARVGDAVIAPQRVRYDIFEGSFLQRGPLAVRARRDQTPVVRGVVGGELVLLPAGTYYVQSTYGEGNAVIRADLRIEPGRLTDATVHHRAAQITLKLVNNFGGEAIANTAWSVLTPGGDSIKESIGAFPTVVLAEGEYIAVARHEGRIYQETFKVQSGRDSEIEVLAREGPAE